MSDERRPKGVAFPRLCRSTGSVRVVWLVMFGLAVLGAWNNLWALLVRLAKIFIGLARGIFRIITCPDPVLCQLADGVDNLGYWLGYWFGYRRFGDDPQRYPRLFTASHVPLTTWLGRPAAGLDSYRRHLRALREYYALAGHP
jgi:hypothetical protein